MVNPLPAIGGVLGTVGDVVTGHPVVAAGKVYDVGKGLVGAQSAEGKKAYDAAGRLLQSRSLTEGAINASEAVGHGLASVIPVLGPLAAQAGERIGQGDVAGGLGQGAGVLAPMGVRPAVQAATRAGQTQLAPMAANIERGAVDRLHAVAAPKIGGVVARRMGTTLAEKVAPRLLREPDMGAWSTGTLRDKVGARLTAAEDALDQAFVGRAGLQPFRSKPVLDALEQAYEELGTVKTSRTGERTVHIPPPREARAAYMRQAIESLKALGPVVTYEDLKTWRASYGDVAKAGGKWNPSTLDDALRLQGAADTAKDITGVLMRQLGRRDAVTKAANAEYSFWRQADDILAAAEESERVRPKVGRRLAAQMSGGVIGGQAAGPLGAVVGTVLGPIVEVAVGAGPTVQIQFARGMTRLADALRAGNVGGARAATFNLQQLAKQYRATTAAAAGREPTAREPIPATP